jgi:hypothetical protein
VQNQEAPDDGRKSARNMYSRIRIQSSFNDFKTIVHLVGFYSLLLSLMHGTMNLKSKTE